MSTRQLPAGAVPSAVARSPVIASVIVSANGQLVTANDTFRRLLGYESLDELRARDFKTELLRHASDWTAWQRTSEDGGKIEVTFASDTGEDVLLSGHVERVPLGGGGHCLAGLLVDNTSARQVREMLLKTAEMEAVSSMAAGVCHDFNNLLTVLVGNLYLAAESLRGDAELHRKIKRARDAAKRGADLSRQLMAFARGVESEPQVSIVDLETVIASLLPLLSAALGSRIALETSFGKDVPSVRVNRAQFESAVTNLVINARDALAGTANGTVSIAVTKALVDPSAASRNGIKQGEYAVLAVRDDGAGMPQRVLQHAFEPFFSTKGRGKGNGLGLPMVRWFAERMDGTVRLTSQVEEGTAVEVWLPACQAEGGQDSTVLTMPLSSLPGGHETVVVLSADTDFQSTIESILTTLGYTVLCADSPATSLSMVVRSGVSAIVVDSAVLTAPTVDEINRFLRRRNERLGIVLVGDKPFTWETTPSRLPKPFGLPELSRAVRKSIEGDR